MRDDDLSTEQQVARDEVADLLQRHAKLLGPWDENGEVGTVAENVFLDGWVLMASWTDEEGESFLTRITSRSLAHHSRVGLLHEGLYGFDE